MACSAKKTTVTKRDNREMRNMGNSTQGGQKPRHAYFVFDSLRRHLENKGGYKTWRELQRQEFPDVPAGTLCRIGKHGYMPQRADLRLRLGLPALSLAPVCPAHSVVHVSRHCPPPRRKLEHDLFALPVRELARRLRQRIPAQTGEEGEDVMG